MAKFFDENGKEVTGFTAEELDAKQKEAVAAYLKDHPDQSAALTEAQGKVTKLEADLKEAGLTDGQKQRLIKERDEATTAVTDLTAKFGKEISDFKTSIFDGFKKKGLDAVSGGKTDVREKIVAKYDSLMKSGDYPTTEEGIQNAIREAATIINGARPAPNFMDGIVTPNGGVRGPADTVPVEESANSKAMRTAFGIKDADAAKFGPKA